MKSNYEVCLHSRACIYNTSSCSNSKVTKLLNGIEQGQEQLTAMIKNNTTDKVQLDEANCFVVLDSY